MSAREPFAVAFEIAQIAAAGYRKDNMTPNRFAGSAISQISSINHRELRDAEIASHLCDIHHALPVRLAAIERRAQAMCPCQLCERFPAEFEDPTFDVSRVVMDARATAKPLLICELCAKTNIETEMMRLGTVLQ